MQKTILLFGGNSDERLVSVASAQNIARKFDFSELWFLNPNGKVFKISLDELVAHQNAFQIQFVPKSSAAYDSLEQSIPELQNKTAFIGFHGTEGEDGKLQQFLEKHKICFTGSGAQASLDSFLKDVSKKIVGKAGVPLAAEICVKKTEAEKIRAFQQTHGKVVIKPLASGSSFGLHIVETKDELEKAIAVIAKENYSDYMIEKFIVGRELTVGVFQTKNELQALPPSEVLLEAGRSFDYSGKYLGTGTREITPAVLTPSEAQAAQKIALDSHRALGCYGYTRTDMILTGEGPVFLETNTLPGLSKASFVPQQLQVAKVELKDFVSNQLELAEIRYR